MILYNTMASSGSLVDLLGQLVGGGLKFPQISSGRIHSHTSYLSRTHGRCPCKFFLAGVNFYRFNAKNWHFRQILREKVAFFLQI